MRPAPPSRSTTASSFSSLPGAHEHVDLALAREQPLDQMAADEAGCPRHEVGRHVFLSSVVAFPERRLSARRQRTCTVTGREKPVSNG